MCGSTGASRTGGSSSCNSPAAGVESSETAAQARAPAGAGPEWSDFERGLLGSVTAGSVIAGSFIAGRVAAARQQQHRGRDHGGAADTDGDQSDQLFPLRVLDERLVP